MILRPHPVLSPVSRRYPGLRGTYLYCPIPSAALGFQSYEKNLAARLACLIHAANVHSEPGSNPSILFIVLNLQKKFRSILGPAPVKAQNISLNRSLLACTPKVGDRSPTVGVSHCMIYTLPDCQISTSLSTQFSPSLLREEENNPAIPTFAVSQLSSAPSA